MIPSQFSLVKLPFALIFDAQDFGDKITLSSRLRGAGEELFDGEPLILPVPAGGPDNVPRIQLQSRDKSYVLQLSRVQLAFEWNQRSKQSTSWDTATAAYFDALRRMLSVFVGEYARPTRFVFKPQLLHHLPGSANEYLRENIFQSDRVERRPFEARFGLMDRADKGDQRVALWMNVTTARQREKPENDNALVVQFEMQSTKRDNANFTAEEIFDTIARTESFIDERIRGVFPDLCDEAD